MPDKKKNIQEEKQPIARNKEFKLEEEIKTEPQSVKENVVVK